MAMVVFIVVLVTIISCTQGNPVPSSSLENHMNARAELIAEEQCMRIGGDVVLNAQENILNTFIMKEKRKTMENSRLNRTVYHPSVSFFLSKPWIEQTAIFKIIRAMPKGASLHLHDHAMGSLEWVIKNVTYRDNVYMCVDQDYFIRLSVFQTPPNSTDCTWKLVKTERTDSANASQFDLKLKQNISMLTSDPLTVYPEVNLVWNRFNKYFDQVIGLVIHAPIMRDLFRQALEEFRADNVQYVEMRGSIAGLTDINGTTQDGEFGVNLYKQVAEEFVRDHPDFSGAKIILSSLRNKIKKDVQEDVKMAIDLRSRYPNFFAGYDLVAQEDPNHSLLYYIEELLYPSQNQSDQLPFFFHAAETNWQGTDVDYNLVDALLLNTTRIGHGYGLGKHPKLVELVKAKGVAVEVNPISNQLLGLVSNLRNHAMTPLIAQNIPIVISSDDPGTWEALPLSHDFYMAFMDMTGEDADLTVLKQLAINSLVYSSMNVSEKAAALTLWESKWDKFVNDTVASWKLVADSSTVDGKTKCQRRTTVTTATANGTALKALPIVTLLLPLFIACLQTAQPYLSVTAWG
jgi:adenosine deaminase CECR1